MIDVLLVGKNTISMSKFQMALDKNGAHTTRLELGKKVLSAIAEKRIDLLIVDETLGDMSGLELIKSVTLKHPMLNCAAISSLSSGEFHQASEGLGVLMQLPKEPGSEVADQLLKHLNRILSVTSSLAPRET